MFDNTIKSNGTQSYKFATITVRVYVDNADIEQAVQDGYYDVVEGKNVPVNETEAFERLSRDRISSLFPTDEPCKLYEIDLK